MSDLDVRPMAVRFEQDEAEAFENWRRRQRRIAAQRCRPIFCGRRSSSPVWTLPTPTVRRSARQSSGSGMGDGSALLLAALVLAISVWYVWQRPTPTADLTILALVVAPLIAKLFFRQIYTSPIPTAIDVLGHLMLVRLTVSVMLMMSSVSDGRAPAASKSARSTQVWTNRPSNSVRARASVRPISLKRPRVSPS